MLYEMTSPRLIAGGLRYLETERATELLRTAQERALHLKAKISIEAYVQQLQQLEESPKSRAPVGPFVSCDGPRSLAGAGQTAARLRRG